MVWEVPTLGEGPGIKADVFISPVNLTANGPTHLGHAGGPYLRMDILGRHLKRLGHNVVSALTTDQFENHIEVQALKAGVERAEFSRSNDELIREGLNALNIKYNIFPNTGCLDISAAFSNTAKALTSALESKQDFDIEEELLPVDDFLPRTALIEDRFCIGGWFGASCPRCGSSGGSYFCEQCGTHFSPSEAIASYSRRGTITEWLPSRSAFLKTGIDEKLKNLWDNMAIQPSYRQIAETYLNNNGSKMRLTIPSAYGIGWDRPHFLDRQALFSYSSLLYAHSLFCGELAQSNSGQASPFAKDSKTTLLSATAIDNVIPMMVGLSGTALSQDSFRPFDRIYFNKFLRLEGSKFSTSRNHVIWVLDIQNQKGINRDLLRAYLCNICPETEETDFLLGDFVAFHNLLLQTLAEGFEQCVLTLKPGVQPLDPDWLNNLNRIYDQQLKAFDDANLRVADCVAPLQKWINQGKQVSTSAQAVTWLVGVSFLGAPVLPSLAADLAEWAGFESLITSENVGTPVSVNEQPLPVIIGEDIQVSDLEKLLPSKAPSKPVELI